MLKQKMEPAASGSVCSRWRDVNAFERPPLPRGCPGVEVEDIDAAGAGADADERARMLRPELAQSPRIGAGVE
jgi:hypothetical protein